MAMGIGKDLVVSDKKNTKRHDPLQSRAFIEKAPEIGADDDKSAADKLVGWLAKTRPELRKSGKK
jgi:hypothetical protein